MQDGFSVQIGCQNLFGYRWIRQIETANKDTQDRKLSAGLPKKNSQHERNDVMVFYHGFEERITNNANDKWCKRL